MNYPLRHDDMVQIADRTRVSIDTLVCGYLRQPLRFNEQQGSTVVGGVCAHFGGQCEYTVDHNTKGYKVLSCNKYQRHYREVVT